MSKVVVTGVNGFVGKHLVQALYDQGCEVVGIGREPETKLTQLLEYYACDLTAASDVSKLPLKKVGAIISLAGLAQVGASFGQEALYNKVNVDVLKVVGEELLHQNLSPRVVAISTGAVYDPNQPLPLTENSNVITSGSPYALSKLKMEQAAEGLRKSGLDCIIMRPLNHIGPGQEKGFLVPDLYSNILAALEENKPLRVGNLATKRDYTDVRDVVRAYIAVALADHLSGTIYNVCSGVSRSGQEILAELQKHIPGSDTLKVEVDPQFIRPNDPPELVGDNERLHRDTGWQPEIPFSKTITDFIESRKK